jgi:hypothetical protein
VTRRGPTDDTRRDVRHYVLEGEKEVVVQRHVPAIVIIYIP